MFSDMNMVRRIHEQYIETYSCQIYGEKARRIHSNREKGAAAYETASEIPDNALNKSDENGCQNESGDNISDSGSTSDDDSVIFMVTKNPSLNHLTSEFVPTQNNDTRDHLLDVRGLDDAFDIDNSFQSEFETRCDDSSIEVSQSENRSDAERSLDYEVSRSRAEELASNHTHIPSGSGQDMSVDSEPIVRKSSRVRKPPDRYGDFEYF